MRRVTSNNLSREDLKKKNVNKKTSSILTKASKAIFLSTVKELIQKLSAKVRKNRHAIADYILLGRLFRIHGELKRAYRLHQNILANPTLRLQEEIALYTELGLDLLELGIKDHGTRYFSKALSLKRNYIPALEGLVRAYELALNFEEAGKTLERLVRLKPSEKTHLAFVLSEHSHQLFERSLFAKARRAAEQALEKDESCPYGLLMLADSHTETQRYDRSISTLHDFLEKWPSHSFLALRRLEDVHYRMNNFPGYEDTLRDCIRATPDNFYLYFSLARHLQKKKKSKDALKHLEHCLELNPLYVNALRDFIRITSTTENAKRIREKTDEFFALYKEARSFVCPTCQARYKNLKWNCSKCGKWDVFHVRYELPAP